MNESKKEKIMKLVEKSWIWIQKHRMHRDVMSDSWKRNWINAIKDNNIKQIAFLESQIHKQKNIHEESFQNQLFTLWLNAIEVVVLYQKEETTAKWLWNHSQVFKHMDEDRKTQWALTMVFSGDAKMWPKEKCQEAMEWIRVVPKNEWHKKVVLGPSLWTFWATESSFEVEGPKENATITCQEGGALFFMFNREVGDWLERQVGMKFSLDIYEQHILKLSMLRSYPSHESAYLPLALLWLFTSKECAHIQWKEDVCFEVIKGSLEFNKIGAFKFLMEKDFNFSRQQCNELEADLRAYRSNDAQFQAAWKGFMEKKTREEKMNLWSLMNDQETDETIKKIDGKTKKHSKRL